MYSHLSPPLPPPHRATSICGGIAGSFTIGDGFGREVCSTVSALVFSNSRLLYGVRTSNNGGDDLAYTADEETLLDLKVTKAEGPDLIVTDVVVTEHTFKSICYTFTVSNAGQSLPPKWYSPKNILLAGNVMIKKKGQPKVSRTYAAGERAGSDSNIDLPQLFARFAPGTSLRTKTPYCSNIESPGIEDYDKLLAAGLMYFSVQLSGYDGWGEDNSPLVQMSPRTTAAITTTTTTQAPEACSKDNRPSLTAVSPAEGTGGLTITIAGDWIPGRLTRYKT